MPPPTASRTPPDPQLYCLLHSGNPNDAAFYLRLCADAQTVLEVGCGDGRLLAPLAQQGQRVVGIEPAAGMRALALERGKKLDPEVAERYTVLDGDMRTLKLGQRFERIIIPYCGLYCLRDHAEVVQALKALAAHLEPGGLLAFDGYAVHDPEGMEGYGDFDHLTTLKQGKSTIEVYERDDHENDRHVVHVTYFHEIHTPGARMKTHSYTLRHHYLVSDAVPELLAQAGLTLLGRFADFEGNLFDESAEHQVVIAGLVSDFLDEEAPEDLDALLTIAEGVAEDDDGDDDDGEHFEHDEADFDSPPIALDEEDPEA